MMRIIFFITFKIPNQPAFSELSVMKPKFSHRKQSLIIIIVMGSLLIVSCQIVVSLKCLLLSPSAMTTKASLSSLQWRVRNILSLESSSTQKKLNSFTIRILRLIIQRNQFTTTVISLTSSLINASKTLTSSLLTRTKSNISLKIMKS